MHLVTVAPVGPARAGDTAVVATLGDTAVGALCAGSDCLPDDFAVVAETELVGAVADY